MKIAIYFSPTGGVKKVLDIVDKMIHFDQWIDLSPSDFDGQLVNISEEDECWVALPVFGGRALPLGIERLRRIMGKNSRCIVIAVYGNRAFEDALLEMKEVCEMIGFKVAAGIAAIAKHSILNHVATHRPDEEDAKILTQYVKLIGEKSTGEGMQCSGNHPYKDFKIILVPQILHERCIRCGKCRTACPNQAIGENFMIDESKCISCMRCVAICPVKAREVEPQRLKMMSEKLAEATADRKEYQLFL